MNKEVQEFANKPRATIKNKLAVNQCFEDQGGTGQE